MSVPVASLFSGQGVLQGVDDFRKRSYKGSPPYHPPRENGNLGLTANVSRPVSHGQSLTAKKVSTSVAICDLGPDLGGRTGLRGGRPANPHWALQLPLTIPPYPFETPFARGGGLSPGD